MKTNKKARLTIDILLIILGIAFLIFGIKDLKTFISNQNVKITDAERFKRDYQYVDTENVYKYIKIKDLSTLLESEEEKIVLIGSPLDPWTQVITLPLNNIVKSMKKNIYYLDLDDVDKESKDYKKVLKALKVATPTVIVRTKTDINILDKQALYDSKYTDSPIEYWTDERTEELERVLNDKIGELK